MPAGTSKSFSFIAVLAILIPCLIGAWFAAPTFLPMYRWTKMDLPKLAKSSGIPLASLETNFQMEVRYHPRGEGDPTPWQIITMRPTWNSVYPTAEDEEKALIRCHFISQNDGKTPSTTFINSTFKDRYYKVTALRLPPGSLDIAGKRPIVVYERMSMEKMNITDAIQNRDGVANWDNDDLWEGRDDGWQGPPAP